MKQIAFRKISGLSLIELLIGMTLSLFILLIVGTVFISSKNTFNYTQNNSRMQESGRFAMDFMSRDIRMVGNNGCTRTPILTNTALPTNNYTNYTVPINGYDDIGVASALPNGFVIDEIKDGTDVLWVQHASGQSQRVSNIHASTGTKIVLDSNPFGFSQDDILVVADCSLADVFRVSGVNTDMVSGKTELFHLVGSNSSPIFSKVYNVEGEVARLETNVYFIGTGYDSDIVDLTNPVCPADSLCVKRINPTSLSTPSIVEIAPNIENMQITYGIDSDGNGTADMITSANAAWAANPSMTANVMSVKVELLAVSDRDQLTVGDQQYDFDGATVTNTADNKLRRVFSNFILLRNRSW